VTLALLSLGEVRIAAMFQVVTLMTVGAFPYAKYVHRALIKTAHVFL
jgi:hypothetical protein